MRFMSISWSKTGSVASMLFRITIEDEANDDRTRRRCNPLLTRPNSSPIHSHKLPANNASLGEQQWSGFQSHLYEVPLVSFRLFGMLLFKVQVNITSFAESKSRGNTITHILWVILGFEMSKDGGIVKSSCSAATEANGCYLHHSIFIEAASR